MTVVPLLATLACSGSQPSAPSPAAQAVTPPAAPAPSGLVNGANWTADATVVAAQGGRACGWGTAPGETRAAVQWRIGIQGDAVFLDEDMPNYPTDDIPFTGRLNGAEFSASYTSNSDYAKYVCPFREASLTGRFDASFTTFEANETLIWGPPGAETIVHRRWTGRRAQ